MHLSCLQFCLLAQLKTRKYWNQKKEKGLIAYAYPQDISDEAAELAVPQSKDGNAESDTATDGKGRKLCETAFVWRRQDGTNALVQTWPTNLNEKFRKDFEISEGVNQDSTKFLPQAASEFQEAMVQLFGPAADSCPLWFCHKRLISTSPAVVGFGEDVLSHVNERPELMRELSIASIDTEGLGFVADGTNGKGEKFEKHFRLTAGEEYVLYRKTGWDTMGCIKPLHQFLSEADLHEPRIVEEAHGMKKEIAATLTENPEPVLGAAAPSLAAQQATQLTAQQAIQSPIAKETAGVDERLSAPLVENPNCVFVDDAPRQAAQLDTQAVGHRRRRVLVGLCLCVLCLGLILLLVYFPK